MKKIIIFGAFLLSFPIFGQYQKGRKFSNEIKVTKGFYRENPIPYQRQHSTSEVFVNIPEGGRFRVMVADQIIENSTGNFRFFDLYSGLVPISIFVDNRLIFKSNFHLRNHCRLVLEFNFQQGLWVVDDAPILGNNTPTHQPYNDSFLMNEEQFSDFFKYFKNQNFDDGKLQAFDLKMKYHRFSSAQIAKLVKELSFDKNKIQLAKNAYQQCIDPENYHKVLSVFDFSTSAKEVQDYINQIHKN